MSAVVVAFGAVSALGVGSAAFDPGQLHEPAPSAVRRDPELAAAGLAKPFAARVADVTVPPGTDRGAALLEAAMEQLLGELERRMPDFRQRRVGLALGTSGGGMSTFQELVARLESGGDVERGLARSAPYFGPLGRIARRLGAPPELRTQLLAACASSTFAIGHALSWLSLGVADLVIAGGYDALSSFIAAGFECLGATSACPTPFRSARDGLALGEGAALLALCRRADAPLGGVLGFGASSDAQHVTAPDRTGAGLAAAARLALADAGLDAEAIGLVSAHGTGTSYNDAAEARAIEAALGPHARNVVVHAFKASIGHTLGAAGALESLCAMSALERNLAPATSGSGEREPALTARLLDRAEASRASACLKLSSAFGGANAALVLSAPGAPSEARAHPGARPVRLLGVGSVIEAVDAAELRGRVLTDPLKLARMDALSLSCVAAALSVRQGVELPGDSAVVVGTAAATLEIDADFERRRLRRGAEPRRFPATSPNLCAGECTIALGLRGPSFSVGAGPAAALEALLVAHDWVSAGRVERALVIAAEQVGAVVQALWRAAEWPVPAHGALAVVLGSGEGRALCRERLVAQLAAAEAARGAVGGEAPGWPSLRRALAELGA